MKTSLFYKFLLVSLAVIDGIALPASAVEASDKSANVKPVRSTEEEAELRRIARNRLYPGGRDEEPLRVQSQLPQATRKMGPAAEAPPESSSLTPSDD